MHTTLAYHISIDLYANVRGHLWTRPVDVTRDVSHVTRYCISQGDIDTKRFIPREREADGADDVDDDDDDDDRIEAQTNERTNDRTDERKKEFQFT